MERQTPHRYQGTAGKDDEKKSFASPYTDLACPYIVHRKYVEAQDGITIMNHSVSVCLYAYIVLDVFHA